MFERFSRFVVYILATSPIWYAPWFLFPAGFGKVPFFAVGVALAMVGAYLSVVRNRQAPVVSWRSPAGVLRLALLLCIAVAVVSAVLGGNAALGFWGSQSRQTGIVLLVHLTALTFLLPAVLRDRRDWMRFGDVLLLSASLPATVALAEAIFPSVRQAFGEASRFSAWFGNPTFSAGYLVAVVLYSGRLLAVGSIPKRLVTAALLLVCTGGILVTGSRGGFLALVAGLGVAAVAAACLYWQELWRRKQAVGVTGIAVLLLTVGLLLSGPTQGLLSRVANADVWLRENQPRLIGWNIAWQGFQARPLLGWGTEQFQTVFDRYYDPQLLKFSFYETVSDKPHNAFLERVATQGALGALALLGVFGALGWAVVSGIRTGAIRREETVSTVALFFGLCVFGLFLFDLLPILIVWYASLAFVCAAPGLANATPQSRQPGSSLERWVWHGLVGACLGSALVLVVWAGPASVFTSRALDARDPDSFVAATRQALAWGGPYLRENRLHLSYAFIRQETAGIWQPEQASEVVDLLVPSFLDDGMTKDDFTSTFVLGQLQAIAAEAGQDAEKLRAAQSAFERALDLSPGRQVAAIQLARVQLMAGNQEEAVAALQRLISDNPDVAEPYWYLGLAYAASGQVAEAAGAFQTALRLGRYPRTVSEVEYVVGVFNSAQAWDDIISVYQHILSTGNLREPAGWHAKLAATYAQAGRLELAVIEAQRAAQIDPSFAAEAQAFIESLQNVGNSP